MVKVEGTLAELRELFMEGAKTQARKEAKKAGAAVVKSSVTKTKRKLSDWNKYVKNKKNQIKLKNGKLNLKKMAVQFRKTQRRK